MTEIEMFTSTKKEFHINLGVTLLNTMYLKRQDTQGVLNQQQRFIHNVDISSIAVNNKLDSEWHFRHCVITFPYDIPHIIKERKYVIITRNRSCCCRGRKIITLENNGLHDLFLKRGFKFY
jgi:hypothetical protein